MTHFMTMLFFGAPPALPRRISKSVDMLTKQGKERGVTYYSSANHHASCISIFSRTQPQPQPEARLLPCAHLLARNYSTFLYLIWKFLTQLVRQTACCFLMTAQIQKTGLLLDATSLHTQVFRDRFISRKTRRAYLQLLFNHPPTCSHQTNPPRTYYSTTPAPISFFVLKTPIIFEFQSPTSSIAPRYLLSSYKTPWSLPMSPISKHHRSL